MNNHRLEETLSERVPTFEDITETLIIHLRGAVEHIAALSESSGEIFRCFRFSRAGGAGRGAPHF